LKGNVPRESSRRFQACPSRDGTLDPRQIAYQNRRDAKYHVIKRLFGPFSTVTVEEVEEVESVERADYPNERSPIRQRVWSRVIA
jgi:hypothetical protein